MVLSKMGLTVESQKPVEVFFRKRMIGQFYVDMVVDGKIIVELKAVRHLLPEHESQILNYLKATQYEVGLLLNFGLKPEIKRFLFDNSRK